MKIETKYSAILKYLKNNLTPERYKHSLGAWKTSVELAKAHGCYNDKVDLAALLHDAGKWRSKEAFLKYVKRNKVSLPYFKEAMKYNPWVLHGFVSVNIAKKIFGIKDKAVLNAIAAHTLGSAKMSTLDKIIYLADMTAPDRRYPLLKKIRWHSKRDLDRAMFIAMDNKIRHVLLTKKWLHPLALASWNGLVEAKQAQTKDTKRR